ncbi:hypothetical protein BT93_L4294 [Corymbia citriodora subsp. variegata]|uniref:Nuclear rim protein 1 n=1 Tax=Corymbia citriodora subsp. variegata TaxID=360336 RepID=A0A8T0CG04_CORYI|nr:hypothetical protein BT93_L4294 [Corymbia citriodora subsp. variegata]
MPAYVRKQSLADRIKSSLNIYDIALWLSEEIESNGWDQLEKEWAIPIGVVFNLIFLVARANGNTRSSSYDDVFVSVLNTVYTFFRKRNYRLFEAPIDTVPSTPSARRVKLNSSPVSSSPLRYLSSLVGADSAESRAHPDAKRDVWEVSVWDPLPLSLRLFCYFSPGHIILYWLFLPTHASDPRPSTTVATVIFVALLISTQLSFLSSNFSQQNKDTSYISKEVLHEYDTKYVKPRTQPLYRDVTTQFSEQASYSDIKDGQYNKVVVFTPTHIINRGFKTNPNPDYTPQRNMDNNIDSDVSRYRTSTPSVRPNHIPSRPSDFSSPLKPSTALRQPTFRPPTSAGGNLGVYTHAASPLRKSASTNFTHTRNGFLEDTNLSKQLASPEKHRHDRLSTPGGAVPRTNADVTRYERQQFEEKRRRRETGNF